MQFPRGFLQKSFEAVKKRGGLFVMDEVSKEVFILTGYAMCDLSSMLITYRYRLVLAVLVIDSGDLKGRGFPLT